MSNPLYGLFGGNNGMPPMLNDFMAKLNQFKSTFRGNPQEEVQKLLNSGKMTQQQFESLRHTADSIMRFMK